MLLNKDTPILSIMGPTATGKTQLIHEISKYFPISVISVDSILIYKYLNIGTDKPNIKQVCFPYYLIDIVEPHEKYSVYDFLIDVNKKIEVIIKSKRIPILVGGSMFYHKMIQEGISQYKDYNIYHDRKNILQKKLKTFGIKYIYNEIIKKNPSISKIININDKYRIIKYYEQFNNLNIKRTYKIKYNIVNIGLFFEDKKAINDSIEKRFYNMINNGLIEEVEYLIKEKKLNETHQSMRAIGYKESIAYISGKISYDNMISSSINSTKKLAKNQITWMRFFYKKGKLQLFHKNNFLNNIIERIKKLYTY